MMKMHLFDVDSTITKPNGRSLYPEVARWFAEHKPSMVALCSNQGGVGLRYWMEPRPEDDYEGFGHDKWPTLPTQPQVEARLAALAAEIQQLTNGRVEWLAAYRYQSRKGHWSPVPAGREKDPAWSKSWRKPNGGMLETTVKRFGADFTDCVFVGDDQYGHDSGAAANAGVKFINEMDFWATPDASYAVGDVVRLQKSASPIVGDWHKTAVILDALGNDEYLIALTKRPWSTSGSHQIEIDGCHLRMAYAEDGHEYADGAPCERCASRGIDSRYERRIAAIYCPECHSASYDFGVVSFANLQVGDRFCYPYEPADNPRVLEKIEHTGPPSYANKKDVATGKPSGSCGPAVKVWMLSR